METPKTNRETVKYRVGCIPKDVHFKWYIWKSVDGRKWEPMSGLIFSSRRAARNHLRRLYAEGLTGEAR